MWGEVEKTLNFYLTLTLNSLSCTNLMISRHLVLKLHTNPTKSLLYSANHRNFHSTVKTHAAHKLFDQIPQTNINTLMLNALHKNHQSQALQIFKSHIQSGGHLHDFNQVTVALALKACRNNLKLGSQIHGFAVSTGFIFHLSVSNSLMNVYCKTGEFDKALCVFGRVSDPDIVSYNTILSGFGDRKKSLKFAIGMNQNGMVYDGVSYTTVLACCSNDEFMFGLQLHGLIFRTGFDSELFVGNALISTYARCGRLIEARKVFDEMRVRDLVSWNAILSGYTQEVVYGLEALKTFLEMVREGLKLDHVSFSSAVSACGHEINLKSGIQIHGLALKTGYGIHVSVGNVLISMYSKCAVVDDAKLVFKGMIERNVISWTTMISIDEENGLSLFKDMRSDGVYPNDVTFIGLIHGITTQHLVKHGQMTHGFCVKTGFCSEFNVCHSLITMYAKFESMQDSVKVFEELRCRETVSWNALISGFAQNGMSEDALHTFLSAIEESKPNEFTFGSILNAIASSEAISLIHGQRCHSHLLKLGLNTDPILLGALLDMYAKRGSISEALQVFNETTQRSQVTWTTLISAYAGHGDYDTVMSLFEQMKIDGIKPDSITFLSLLTACGRKGMVDMGRKHFHSMVNDYRIEPSPEHFSFMADMLGRAGRLKEAEELSLRIPQGPGLSVLQSLLGSSKLYGNVEMAERVGDALIKMEQMGSGSLVLLSNLYAEKEQWDKVKILRKLMREKGVKKDIGFSWVDVGARGDGLGSLYMHRFSSGDTSHPWSQAICETAKFLGFETKFLEKHTNYVCIES